MSSASIASGPTPAPTDVIYLRHVYMLDADLGVLLVGTAPDRLVETSGETLAPAIAAEVRKLIATHDFKRRPVATGLVGAEFGLRIVRTPGPAGSFYTLFTERIRLARRLKSLSRRFGLTPPETELLRLVAGGYQFAEMVERLQLTPTVLRANLRELEEKVGCIGRRELALLALNGVEPSVSSPLPASFPVGGSSTYPGRRAGSRHR